MIYRGRELSFIRVNNLGKLIIKAFDSDVAIEQTMEQLFIKI